MDQSKHCPCPGTGCNWPEGECLEHCTPIRFVEPPPKPEVRETLVPRVIYNRFMETK